MKATNLKRDIPASIVVFLVALPLCLGVALASGAPLISGIISGIIGGIVVGLFSSSHTSVSGPAAGLTAVVFGSIAQLGFEVFLLAVVICGIIQIMMGFLKAGLIANYIPSNVIKGLLAAIGIILILKQIPHALGYDKDVENDFSFFQIDGENTLSELLEMLNFVTPGAIIISAISIVLLIFWERSPLSRFKFLSGSLFVVILGVVLNYIFMQFVPALALEASHLVAIPPVRIDDLSSFIHLPDFNHLKDYHVILAALTIAAVASLETLLNLEAIDKMDPHKRESDPNRELMAQGIGNIMAGLFGGIPITSVVVRSSVNINAGNESKLSTILHGIFILISVVALAGVLNLIPLASLAAILLITGYKLTRVTIFREIFKKGWHQFIPFVVTILAIVFTDLLIGVLIGLTVSMFYLIRSNYRNPFIMDKDKLHVGEVVRLELANQVSFFNKPSIKDTLWQVPGNTKVIIDATYSDFIDNDVLEIIDDFKSTVAPERNIQLNVLGLKDKYELSDHIQFINVLDKDTQSKLSPSEILNLLKIGNNRFVTGKWNEKYFRHQVNATSMGQNPMAVIVSCIDSRTSPEIVFDAGIGDLLTIRIAGNIISPEILGSIELSVKKIGAKLIVIMSHSNCGAISLAINQVKEGNIGYVTSKIDKAIAQSGFKHSDIDAHNHLLIEKITMANAENSIAEIFEQSEYLRSHALSHDIAVVAAYYDTSTGKVNFSKQNL
ncbi:MAG: SulP family inorganic anion transporter [Bacteroidota bacterium]|nr:SulP family inorganic anion transporter [Bacteroidota bacterium]